MDGAVVPANALSSASTTTTSLITPVSPQVLVEYIVDALKVTLGATRRDLEAPGSLLDDTRYADTIQRCQRFASEPLVAMYVAKDLVEVQNENGETRGMFDVEEMPLHYPKLLPLITCDSRNHEPNHRDLQIKSRPLPYRTTSIPSLLKSRRQIRP
jgi:hypothetical protein